MSWASSSDKNQCWLKHSWRNFPLNDSMNALAVTNTSGCKVIRLTIECSNYGPLGTTAHKFLVADQVLWRFRRSNSPKRLVNLFRSPLSARRHFRSLVSLYDGLFQSTMGGLRRAQPETTPDEGARFSEFTCVAPVFRRALGARNGQLKPTPYAIRFRPGRMLHLATIPNSRASSLIARLTQ